MTPARRLYRVAAWCAYSSAAVGAVGVLSLIVFFVVGEPYGTLNDIAVLVQYLLALPVVLAIHTVMRMRSPQLSMITTAIGLIGIIVVIVLQLLLIIRVLTFVQQSVPVSVALFVGVNGWILLVGYMTLKIEDVRSSRVWLAVAGWSYVG